MTDQFKPLFDQLNTEVEQDQTLSAQAKVGFMLGIALLQQLMHDLNRSANALEALANKPVPQHITPAIVGSDDSS